MNARENPFATRRVERALEFDPTLIGTDWSMLLQRWRALGQRACITGPHGAGKTTFLDAFVHQLDPPVVRWFFNRDQCGLTDHHREQMRAGRGAIWIVDGDGHLGWRDRREFRRRSMEAAGVLSARHRARDMPVLLHLRPDLALAKSLLDRIDPEDRHGLAADLPRRFRRCRGNLRELWLDCYDAMISEM